MVAASKMEPGRPTPAVFRDWPAEALPAVAGKRFFDLGLSFADRQRDTTTPDGITAEARYWIDEPSYGPAARKAWLGLVKYIDADANFGNVCAGTNKGTTVQYYLDRPRNTGDLHGQAPILWTASALLR